MQSPLFSSLHLVPLFGHHLGLELEALGDVELGFKFVLDIVHFFPQPHIFLLNHFHRFLSMTVLLNDLFELGIFLGGLG